jgi:hypothetical protein
MCEAGIMCYRVGDNSLVQTSASRALWLFVSFLDSEAARATAPQTMGFGAGG